MAEPRFDTSLVLSLNLYPFRSSSRKVGIGKKTTPAANSFTWVHLLSGSGPASKCLPIGGITVAAVQLPTLWPLETQLYWGQNLYHGLSMRPVPSRLVV